MVDQNNINLAEYACKASESRGRLHNENECSTRSVYQRDRDRIIHSSSFRRLEYKTQVFVNHEGDHYRTRLTHSLEVAQLSRSMCRALRLDEDLGEALALAHDLGHTPFGHAGEDGLKEAMKKYGGFDHNAQAIRVLTHLEQRYASFDGLNLTWETLEGLAKHNGPVIGNPPRVMAEYLKKQDLMIGSYAGAEAQVAAISDDIAYNNHDIEDGIRAGLFSIDELSEIAFIGDVIKVVDELYPLIDEHRKVHEVIRRIVNGLVNDVIVVVEDKISVHNPMSSSDIRELGCSFVHFSSEVEKYNKQLKKFLMHRMYRHYKVNRSTSKARRVIQELFEFFHAEHECLPTEWRLMAENKVIGDDGRAHIVADFIAGMTDRFALDEHRRIFNPWDKN